MDDEMNAPLASSSRHTRAPAIAAAASVAISPLLASMSSTHGGPSSCAGCHARDAARALQDEQVVAKISSLKAKYKQTQVALKDALAREQALIAAATSTQGSAQAAPAPPAAAAAPSGGHGESMRVHRLNLEVEHLRDQLVSKDKKYEKLQAMLKKAEAAAHEAQQRQAAEAQPTSSLLSMFSLGGGGEAAKKPKPKANAAEVAELEAHLKDLMATHQDHLRKSYTDMEEMKERVKTLEHKNHETQQKLKQTEAREATLASELQKARSMATKTEADLQEQLRDLQQSVRANLTSSNQTDEQWLLEKEQYQRVFARMGSLWTERIGFDDQSSAASNSLNLAIRQLFNRGQLDAALGVARNSLLALTTLAPVFEQHLWPPPASTNLHTAMATLIQNWTRVTRALTQLVGLGPKHPHTLPVLDAELRDPTFLLRPLAEVVAALVVLTRQHADAKHDRTQLTQLNLHLSWSALSTHLEKGATIMARLVEDPTTLIERAPTCAFLLPAACCLEWLTQAPTTTQSDVLHPADLTAFFAGLQHGLQQRLIDLASKFTAASLMSTTPKSPLHNQQQLALSGLPTQAELVHSALTRCQTAAITADQRANDASAFKRRGWTKHDTTATSTKERRGATSSLLLGDTSNPLRPYLGSSSPSSSEAATPTPVALQLHPRCASFLSSLNGAPSSRLATNGLPYTFALRQQADLASLSRNYDVLTETFRGLEHQHAQLEADNSKLNRDHDQLMQAMDEKLDEMAQAEAEAHQRQEELQAKTRQLEEKTIDLHSLQIVVETMQQQQMEAQATMPTSYAPHVTHAYGDASASEHDHHHSRAPNGFPLDTSFDELDYRPTSSKMALLTLDEAIDSQAQEHAFGMTGSPSVEPTPSPSPRVFSLAGDLNEEDASCGVIVQALAPDDAFSLSVDTHSPAFVAAAAPTTAVDWLEQARQFEQLMQRSQQEAEHPSAPTAGASAATYSISYEVTAPSVLIVDAPSTLVAPILARPAPQPALGLATPIVKRSASATAANGGLFSPPYLAHVSPSMALDDSPLENVSEDEADGVATMDKFYSRAPSASPSGAWDDLNLTAALTTALTAATSTTGPVAAAPTAVAPASISSWQLHQQHARLAESEVTLCACVSRLEHLTHVNAHLSRSLERAVLVVGRRTLQSARAQATSTAALQKLTEVQLARSESEVAAASFVDELNGRIQELMMQLAEMDAKRSS